MKGKGREKEGREAKVQGKKVQRKKEKSPTGHREKGE